jgi:hypothetical protein
LFNQRGPVGNSAEKTADVNIVEMVFSICPLALCVVDFEADVRWNPVRGVLVSLSVVWGVRMLRSNTIQVVWERDRSQ